MRQPVALLLVVLVSQVYSAPQFITFNDGKLGVNFGGYHAGVGLGGILGGGAGGGLFAEAGTPYGQEAKAGLGGAVDSSGSAAGGLYAGATAGGNVKASTGLAGGVAADRAAGSGFATAQAGNNQAAAGLGGDASVAGSGGFSFSGSKSVGVSGGVVKHVDVEARPVKPITKKVHKEINVDAANEVNIVPLTETRSGVEANVNVQAAVQPAVIVKEVYVEQPPPQIIEKHYIRTHHKPSRHHLRKTAYIGGYVGAGFGGGAGAGAVAPPPPPPPQVVYKKVQPTIEKRIDIGAESSANAGADVGVKGHGGGEISYTKQVTFQRNPNFFADIFNIPISTLKAVGNFLGNAAGSTSVSVQKSASVHADSDSSPIHERSSHSESSSDAQISVKTPSATQIIDDIIAIPINTLGAVNKFLENNVPARKRVQVSQDGPGEPTKVRLGPHARRRANKHVVVLENEPETSASEVKPETEVKEE